MWTRGATLIITDTSAAGNGRIEDGNSSNGGGGIHAKKNSRIYMYGGAISSNSATHEGAAIYVNYSGYIYLAGGIILNNSGYSIIRQALRFSLRELPAQRRQYLLR